MIATISFFFSVWLMIPPCVVSADAFNGKTKAAAGIDNVPLADAQPEDTAPGDSDPEATPTDARETEAPACGTTGEHDFTDYLFSEDGRHSATCSVCGETFLFDCIYEELPFYTSEGNGYHYDCCILCGGKRISACAYIDNVITPTEAEAGCTVHRCALCGYQFADETTSAERDRQESALMGDIDGDKRLEPSDARDILRASVHLTTIGTEHIPYADLDEDGDVSPADARLALRICVKLDPETRHDYAATVNVEPTCETEGSVSCSCGYCGQERIVTAPATGHRFRQIDSAEPTCVVSGKDTYECSVCRKTKETIKPATGHRWVEATLSRAKHCENCGEMITGWTEVGNRTVYFLKDGTVPAGNAVLYLDYQGEKCNWYLKNGQLDKSVRAGITINGENWIVTEGRAKKAVSEADKTLFRAYLAVAKATTPDMTKAQKLRACFNYVKTAYGECSPRNPHYLGADWPVLYANDMFINGKGNCFSYAAAFGYMAKAIGYEEVYCCNSTGHGWTEIDGKVYDPEWSKGNFNSTFFGISYSDRVGVNYSVILPMIGIYSFAHVKR